MGSAQILYKFPSSSSRHIPLFKGEEHLHIGLVEIGCQSYHQPRQLHTKRQLLHKYYGDTYRTLVEGRLESVPIHRVLGYFHPNAEPRLYGRRPRLEAVIHYKWIPEEALHLNEIEKDAIYHVVNSNKKRKDLLEDILKKGDAERLHTLIVKGGGDHTLDWLRGTMAEVIVLRDIRLNRPRSMEFLQNSFIHCDDRRYPTGTEVDGVLLDYGQAPFRALVESLRACEHLNVRDRWSTPNPFASVSQNIL